MLSCRTSTDEVGAEGSAVKSRRGRIIRWICAGLLSAGLLVVTTVSTQTGQFRICEDTVVQVTSHAITKACRPVKITDTPVILALIFIVGLISPEFRKINIVGLVELEREVSDQEARLNALELRVTTISANTSTAAANLYIGSVPPALGLSAHGAVVDDNGLDKPVTGTTDAKPRSTA